MNDPEFDLRKTEYGGCNNVVVLINKGAADAK